MRICGLQKLAMVDFPGKLAATVFTGGCNLRCPFCHNALLVTRLDESPELTEQEVLDFLAARRGLLDGVVLSGGEPLLQPGVIGFLQKIREMGYAIKVDTNGCYPDVLAEILAQGLTDYVAMDIKNCREKYAETVGFPSLDLAPVEKSIRLLQQSGVEFEFRTTVVREFHTPDDIRAIGQWLAQQFSADSADGSIAHSLAPRYFLQPFADSGSLIYQGLHGLEPAEMRLMAETARPFFKEVSLRGVD